jgi:hypothetical protein
MKGLQVFIKQLSTEQIEQLFQNNFPICPLSNVQVNLGQSVKGLSGFFHKPACWAH